MLRILIITISVLTPSIRDAAATSCHDLHQSQLLSLNERMNQMIDTISALLPTPLKKSTSPVTPALTPSTDYTPTAPTYESTYYSSPPAYTSPTPTPYIMYVSPPVAPQPTAVGITPHVPPNSFKPPPRHYSSVEPNYHPEYSFPPVSNLSPRRVRSQYQYDHYPLLPYQSSIPMAHLPPSSYPVPYSFMQPPYSPNYNSQYSPELSYAAPPRPNIPTCAPSPPPPPLPVYSYVPPNTFMPIYSNLPELPPPLYT